MRAMLADRSRSALADPHRFPYSPICRSASIPRLPTSMRPVDANSRRRIRIRTSGSPPSRPRPTARTHLSGSNPSPIAQARTGLRRLDPFVAGVEQPSPRSETGPRSIRAASLAPSTGWFPWADGRKRADRRAPRWCVELSEGNRTRPTDW